MRKLAWIVLVASVGCSKAKAGEEPAAKESGLTKVTAPTEPAALTAEELVKRHLDAQGGEARMKAVRTLTFTAVETFDGKKATIRGTRMRPNLMRYDIERDGEQFVKQFDGQTGFVTKAGKVEKVEEKYQASMQRKAAFDDVLIDWQAKGVKLALAASTAESHQLEITYPDGEKEVRFIDAKSFLETKRATNHTDKDGKASVHEMTLSDYRDVNGIQVNFRTEWVKDGKKGEWVIQTVAYDTPVSADLFKAPQP
jgi:hypothetical protein